MTTPEGASRPWAPSSDPAPGEVDSAAAAIEYRLISMRKSVGQLESYGPIDTALLEHKPDAGLVAERILFFLNDLAFEINGFIARVVLGRTPRSLQDSFEAAVLAGVIEADLATRLHPDDPLHIVLQLSLDADPDAVKAIVSDALSDFTEYIVLVAAWASERSTAS